MPNLMEKSVAIIIGSLLCIRQCIPFLHQKLKDATFDNKIEDCKPMISSLIQVSIFFCSKH